VFGVVFLFTPINVVSVVRARLKLVGLKFIIVLVIIFSLLALKLVIFRIVGILNILDFRILISWVSQTAIAKPQRVVGDRFLGFSDASWVEFRLRNKPLE